MLLSRRIEENARESINTQIPTSLIRVQFVLKFPSELIWWTNRNGPQSEWMIGIVKYLRISRRKPFPGPNLRTMDSTTVGVVLATTFSVGTVLALCLNYGFRWDSKSKLTSNGRTSEKKGPNSIATTTTCNIASKKMKPIVLNGLVNRKQTNHHNNAANFVPVKVASESSLRSLTETKKQNNTSEKSDETNVFPKVACTQKQAKLSKKLEEVNAQVKHLTLLRNNNDAKLTELQKEVDEKSSQIQRYELANRSLSEKVQELESLLKTKDNKIEQLLANKKKLETEVYERISSFESDRNSMSRALEDQVARSKAILETNQTLERSIIDLKSVNLRQEEVIKHLQGERATYEQQMRQTLNEMSSELRELQSRLSTNAELSGATAKNHEINKVQLLEMAQREKELRGEMRRLQKSLSALFPDIKVESKSQDGSANIDWVGLYVAAMKQLSKNVEDLRKASEMQAHQNDVLLSPSKKSTMWHSSPKRSTKGLGSTGGDSPRTGSPTSNGRSSRGSSYYADKKLAETRLVESLALFCLRCLD